MQVEEWKLQSVVRTGEADVAKTSDWGLSVVPGHCFGKEGGRGETL